MRKESSGWGKKNRSRHIHKTPSITQYAFSKRRFLDIIDIIAHPLRPNTSSEVPPLPPGSVRPSQVKSIVKSRRQASKSLSL